MDKEHTMKVLGITEKEYQEMVACDKAIDRGEKLFELDPELAAGAKKARQAERKKNAAPAKREKKENADKRELITLLSDALGADKVTEIPNPEREIIFTYNGVKYKLVLSCPRS